MKILSLQNIQSNWNLIKVLKIILAITVIYQSVQAHDIALSMFGSFFMIQAFLNIGCCGPNGCGIDPAKKTGNNQKEIQFEEITPIEKNK